MAVKPAAMENFGDGKGKVVAGRSAEQRDGPKFPVNGADHGFLAGVAAVDQQHAEHLVDGPGRNLGVKVMQATHYQFAAVAQFELPDVTDFL